MMLGKRIRCYWQSLGVVLTLDVLLCALLKLLRWVNTWLLVQSEVPFVSLVNLRRIITNHGWVAIAVVIELLLVAFCLVVFLTALMVGIETVLRGQNWGHFCEKCQRALTQFRLLTLGLLLVDFVVLAPLFSIAFRTPLLTAVRIPEFILDYGNRNGWLIAITLLIYIICWPLAIRTLTAWPLINQDGKTMKQALRQSWQRTSNGSWWPMVLQLGKVLVVAAVSSWLVNVALYGVQRWLGKNQLWLSTGSLIVAQLVALLLCSWVLLRWTMILTDAPSSQRPRCLFEGWTLIALLAVMVHVGIVGNDYFQPRRLKMPVTVSHRGVADENGVQNSLTALRRTSCAYHPDYVEMDLHETKDHQFVVIHDENLKELAGVKKRPGELTLRQLQRLTIKENGQRDHLASFDDYLKTAEQLHQKLVVELKTTQYDSPDVVERFNRQYGRMIVDRHYLVHSLDYGLIQRLHQLNPAMKILYLQAYNFSNPLQNVTGFNNEYSTLNQRFINAAHHRHQLVYAWTVDNRGAMAQLMNQQVDGIVTNKMPELQRVLRRMEQSQSRANRFWDYLNPVANWPE